MMVVFNNENQTRGKKNNMENIENNFMDNDSMKENTNEDFSFTLGDDIGNGYTKTSVGVRFKSLVSRNYDNAFVKNSFDVIYDGELYKVGDEAGLSFFGPSKYDNPLYKVTLATSIVKSGLKLKPDARNFKVKIVLGTPVDQYEGTKKDVIRSAKEIKNKDITIDGVKYKVTVDEVIVASQSAILNDNEINTALVFDFGAGTFDVAKWTIENGKFYKDTNSSSTMSEFGFEKFIDKFINTLISDKNTNLRSVSHDDAIRILITKKKKIKGKYIDFSSIVNTMLQNYANEIAAALEKKDISIDCDKLYITGACANLMKPYILKACDIDNEGAEDYVIIDNQPQFSNALAYGRIAKLMF